MTIEGTTVTQDLSQEEALWQDWLVLRNSDIRTRLFFFYCEWARRFATYLFGRYPHPLAEWADYLNLASLGLLQAIDGFDPLRQVRFKTYAEPFLKGAVLKGLSCYIKDNRPIAKDRLSSLTSEDRFADIDTDLELVINAAVDLAFGYFLELGIVDAAPVENDPLSHYTRESENLGLGSLVENLPERERQVIVGHYYQQLSFVELSDLMGVSKSRISQLHSQALKKIRKSYEEQDAMEISW
jgi:RNA polymerase sigma factor for flagellar operon FliA